MKIVTNTSDPFFMLISTNAHVVADVWKGYLPLKDEYDLEQKPSNNGTNFPQLHISRLVTRHTLHCSKERLQGYLNEYHYRYNRCNDMETIFDLTLKRMVNKESIRL